MNAQHVFLCHTQDFLAVIKAPLIPNEAVIPRIKYKTTVSRRVTHVSVSHNLEIAAVKQNP